MENIRKIKGKVSNNMKISKIFNNNCVGTVISDVEYVLTGSGLGFQKKVGDVIDARNIEKKFSLISEDINEFEQLLDSIPITFIEATRSIIEYAEQEQGIILDDTVNNSLTAFILKLILNPNVKLRMRSLFSNQIRLFCPAEYNVALWTHQFLSLTFNIDLPQEIIPNIASYIVNTRIYPTTTAISKEANFSNEVISLIEYELNSIFDTSTFQYNRLMAHLKYLGSRVFDKSDELKYTSNVDDLEPFMNTILKQYHSCLSAVTTFIKDKFEYIVSPEDKMFLLIHISQLADTIEFAYT